MRADAQYVLRAMGREDAEVTVVLAGDSEVRELNRRFRSVDRPTDVLAFALREGRALPGGERILGDVVISVETAARQARRHRRPLAAEVRTLLVHGLLHLLGYDHEKSAAARRMRSTARALERALRRRGAAAGKGAKWRAGGRGSRSRRNPGSRANR